MKRVGILPGTFDPPHLGHLDLIQKAQKICDHLIIAALLKPEKKPIFSIDERLEMLIKIAPSVEMLSFDGLVVDLVKKKGAAFLIRGLKAHSEFDLEFRMAEANRKLENILTIFLLPNSEYCNISSTTIREILHFNGPLEQFVPKEILGFISKKFS